MGLGVRDGHPHLLKYSAVLLEGTRVRDAGDLREQRVERRRKRSIARHIGETEPSTRSQHTGELGRCGGLRGERAERALAEQCVDRPVGKRQPLGIPDLDVFEAMPHDQYVRWRSYLRWRAVQRQHQRDVAEMRANR